MHALDSIRKQNTRAGQQVETPDPCCTSVCCTSGSSSRSWPASVSHPLLIFKMIAQQYHFLGRCVELMRQVCRL
jgi:hypothetical protein